MVEESYKKSGNSYSGNSYVIALIFMVSLFFLFGFVTVMNDILIPHLKGLFDLSNVEAMLVQFCFFGAYFIMSLPAGWLLSKIGYKRGIVLSLSVVGAGLLLFVPAASLISYPFFLFALFIIGSGITVLQVAANPYLSLLGPIESGSTRINLAGGFNSLAATIGPMIGAYFIFIDPTSSSAAKAAATQIPYLGLAVFVFILAIIFSIIKLPQVLDKTGDQVHGNIWRFLHLKLGALAIFFYVGAEVAVGSLLIGYMSLPENGSLDASTAAKYVSYYWGSAMVGRFFGFIFLSKIKTSLTLSVAAGFGLLFTTIALFISGPQSIWCIVLLGLCHSVMWPCIFPLSIEGLGKFTSLGSAMLVMMVVGGALIPVLQGYIIDIKSYKASFIIELVCYGYILFFGIKGYKNKVAPL